MAVRSQMGVVAYALAQHQRQGWEGRHAGLSPAQAFLEEAARFGAGAIQVGLGAREAAQAVSIRRRAEALGMAVEAIVDPPAEDAEVERFERDVRVARDAGATLARTVILPGRRYERFRTLAEFREFERRGFAALQRAEPVLARHRFQLAVENHKDQLLGERLEFLRRLGSEWVGICVDLGNSFALLEDPLETVRAFAPLALTVHIKDQAVREYDQGFLFADRALGDGMLDLPALVDCLRQARPGIRFQLETITRDALEVPILAPDYWATLGEVPAAALARTWATVKRRAHPEPFPNVSGLSAEAQVGLERRNVERSFACARERLGL